jgi:nucleotide-binding universal stress UspA family protein
MALVDLDQGKDKPVGDDAGHIGAAARWREEEAMGFKDILVALDTGPAARGRVELAASLAERFDAHLIGLHTSVAAEAPRRPGYFELFDRSLLDPLYRDFAEKMRLEADEMRSLFEEITNRRGLSAEWRTASRAASGSPSEITAMHGRYADLIVLGQIDPDDTQALLFRPLPEEVALAVGRPILVIPYVGSWPEIGRRVLIGWDDSREATRAINDAVPLLVGAESVTILAVDPAQGPRNLNRSHGEVPGADIALHLARHGVKATTERTVSAGIGAGNALLSRASDLEADLLVMGVYGHSRVRELLLGGATRTVLESMTLPILMAH